MDAPAIVSSVADYRIAVTIAPRALLRAQDGVDLEATGAAFLAALEPVLRRDVAELAAGAPLTLHAELGASAHRVEVEGPDEASCTRIEREVRDLLWVVRECVPFAVTSR